MERVNADFFVRTSAIMPTRKPTQRTVRLIRVYCVAKHRAEADQG